MQPGPLISVRDLSVDFTDGRAARPALRRISLDIHEGDAIAAVGESGSGKSTLVRALLGLLPENAAISGGTILIDGRDSATFGETDWNAFRGRVIGYVPQDPQSNLDPLRRVGEQATIAAQVHGLVERRDIRSLAVATLERVGIRAAAQRHRSYPHQLSGGMRQRVLIGGAIVTEPRLLLADEPTSGLDVTTQKKILDELDRLAASDGFARLIVTHDLGVAATRSRRIIILYHGEIVEDGASDAVFAAPRHDYTRRLLAASPQLSSPSLVHAGDGPAAPFIELRNVSKSYPTWSDGRRSLHPVVSDVSFSLPTGRTLGLVGESSSGKSTVARIILNLTRADKGRVLVEGRPADSFDRAALRRFRTLVQPVFQDPSASLDPRYTVRQAIGEPLDINRRLTKAEQARRIDALLDAVVLPREFAARNVRELSGGQKQRVAIARALALDPQCLILDEAVSALDVIVQHQILLLLAKLQRERGLTYLFITHDLAVVRSIAHEVVVMQSGRVVEAGPVEAVFAAPKTDYVRELLAAVPQQQDAARTAA